jgi:phosphatidylethanolamine/phosphatidyl-N-methylethanolamine N-methyltransferase
MPKKKKSRHRLRSHNFLAAWLRSPLSIGSVIPSSRALARAMASQLDLERPGIVIELGPGTGVITHALLQAGVPAERLLVIERDEKLHKLMSSQFSDLNIILADAAHLDQVLESLGIDRVNAIISSLPLLTMPKDIKHTIEHCMATVIEQDGGIIVQFTYGPSSPISQPALKSHGLAGKRVKTVLTNVPPAHVWVYGPAKN